MLRKNLALNSGRKLEGLPYDEFVKLRDNGPRGVPTAIVWNECPGIQNIKVQREIMERPDLTSDAKLVYALIDFYFPIHPQLGAYLIAGLLGMSTPQVHRAVHELEAVGLMKRITHKERTASGGVRSQPGRYHITHVPRRFGNVPPTFLAMPLDDFDNKLKSEVFPKVDFDHELN